MKKELPLVSILIPNFNHSRYLDQCVQSAINQTYPNKEIIVLDNSSDDSSVDILEKYIKDGVRVCRNQYNIMNFNYKVLVNTQCNGKYFILLCADDYLMTDFIQNAVAIMERNNTVGYVHGEKDFVTENDELIELDPFYKCSFIAPGKDTMPVYMVTPVAHPAQAVVRLSTFRESGGYDMEIDHMNADRSLWFYMSYYGDAAYIKEKMSHIRIGSQTETVITQQNFQHPILCHLTLKDYVKFAKEKDIPQVYNRENEAIERFSHELVGYAGGMLYNDNVKVAEQYLKYAYIVNRKIINNDMYMKYSAMCDNEIDKEYIKAQNKVSYSHKRGYEPPDNYEEIDVKGLVQWMKQEYKY